MNTNHTELITVPTFTFNQGDPFAGDGNAERPITVSYYDGSIELSQDGEYDTPEKIIILPNSLDKLLKAIKKHQPDAEAMLSRYK